MQGAKVALVGANGQGKSTLVRLMLGELSPGAGLVQRHAQCRIGVFAQDNVEALVVRRGSSSALAYMKELHPEGARPLWPALGVSRHKLQSSIVACPHGHMFNGMGDRWA